MIESIVHIMVEHRDIFSNEDDVYFMPSIKSSVIRRKSKLVMDEFMDRISSTMPEVALAIPQGANYAMIEASKTDDKFLLKYKPVNNITYRLTISIICEHEKDSESYMYSMLVWANPEVFNPNSGVPKTFAMFESVITDIINEQARSKEKRDERIDFTTNGESVTKQAKLIVSKDAIRHRTSEMSLMFLKNSSNIPPDKILGSLPAIFPEFIDSYEDCGSMKFIDYTTKDDGVHSAVMTFEEHAGYREEALLICEQMSDGRYSYILQMLDNVGIPIHEGIESRHFVLGPNQISTYPNLEIQIQKIYRFMKCPQDNTLI